MRKEIRQWWKKNKNKVIICGAIAGAIGGYIWSKKTGVTVDYDQEAADFVSKYMTKAPEVAKKLSTFEKAANEAYSKIDEKVFTDMAVELENMILEEGTDESLLEYTVTVPFAKFGDFSKGLYETTKKVQIYVQDITDPE